MRIRLIAALSVAGVFALGCSDSPRNTPTDPDVDLRFAKSTGGACDAGVSRTAKAQLQDLLAGNTLKQAQALWSAVEIACSPTNPDAANSALFAYLNYLQGLYPASFITSKAGDKATLYAAHINTVFGYVGYSSPGVTKTLLDGAIVGVIPSTGGTREYIKEHLGGFKLAVQDATGDQRGHLFLMYSLPTTDCLSVDNLQEFGTCVEVSSFPSVNPKWSPGIQVGLCTEASHASGAPALGHQTGSVTEVAGSLAYPTLEQCHPPTVGSSWLASPGSFLKRLAWTAKSMFRTTTTAYATDKGVGGIGGSTSPFGVLDAQIFAAEFNAPANVVGSPPDTVNGNYHFSLSVTPPGSILVQSSLGTYTGPLVVLSQGGGNCEACGGLALTAKFFSVSDSAANDGVYEVNWTSLQASPSVKGAPFVVRDASGREIARVTYKTVTSANVLMYNDSITVGTWTRNAAQTFSIIVNLNTGKTSLLINGVAVAAATNKSFQNAAANSLATLGAEFSGIDSGVMGWDQIGVRRMADQPQPST